MQYITLILSGTCSALASILLRLAGTLPVSGHALVFGMEPRAVTYRLGAIAAYSAGLCCMRSRCRGSS